MNLCVCKGSVYELCLHIWIFAYICGSVCISWCVDLHVWGVCVWSFVWKGEPMKVWKGVLTEIVFSLYERGTFAHNRNRSKLNK